MANCLYCDAPQNALGLCKFHWQRWYKRTPMEMPRGRPSYGWVDSGYRHISTPDRGEIEEHRYIMEKHLGRILETDECVHHKNHDKLDNRLENLEVIDRAAHTSLHQNEGGERRPAICPECSTPFFRLSWKPNQTCSKSCGLKRNWREIRSKRATTA